MPHKKSLENFLMPNLYFSVHLDQIQHTLMYAESWIKLCPWNKS